MGDGTPGQSKGLAAGPKTGRIQACPQVLPDTSTWISADCDRNVHRTLTSARTSNGMLSYHDHGLLLSAAEDLLQKGLMRVKRAERGEFQLDVQELVQGRGIERQEQVVERMRWYVSS